MSEHIELLTKAEVAELLKISEDTVEKLIRGGQLPAYRIAKTCTRIDRADVMEYLESRRSRAAALQRKTRVRVPQEIRRGGINNSGYYPGMKVVDPNV